jgi:(p)ppGpp synthase/HD superfamily hydrolase
MDLEEASELAYRLHRHQRDKGGQPYYLHVATVRDMLTGEDEEVRIAAVLHDSVEDTDMTLDELRRLGCAERTLAAIDSVTRREDETYLEFVARARQNPDGRKIKLADNLHNTMRLGNLEPKQAASMAKRYANARAILLEG